MVTYARIVVDYRPQKEDPNRVRITVGGNLIDYPGELTTRTADLTTAKILWNSTLSTPGAKFSAADVGNFYLATPLDRFEYMKIKAELVPEEFKKQYKLHDKIYKGFIYMEIRRGCYGLPQSGILANKLLKKRMAKHGYFELPHTPGLWKHVSRPVQFMLIVDSFGVKYVVDKHFKHLINALKEPCEVSVNKTGGLYCGITRIQQMHSQYFNARICPKTINKMKSPHTKNPTTLSMFSISHHLWNQNTGANPPQQKSTAQRKPHK